MANNIIDLTKTEIATNICKTAGLAEEIASVKEIALDMNMSAAKIAYHISNCEQYLEGNIDGYPTKFAAHRVFVQRRYLCAA